MCNSSCVFVRSCTVFVPHLLCFPLLPSHIQLKQRLEAGEADDSRLRRLVKQEVQQEMRGGGRPHSRSTPVSVTARMAVRPSSSSTDIDSLVIGSPLQGKAPVTESLMLQQEMLRKLKRLEDRQRQRLEQHQQQRMPAPVYGTTQPQGGMPTGEWVTALVPQQAVATGAITAIPVNVTGPTAPAPVKRKRSMSTLVTRY